MQERSDAQLIRQTLAGDDFAFDALVERYQSTVFRWIRQTCPLSADQDLAQEVFIEAYFNLDTLREPCKFKGWLKTIVRNVCVSWLRRRKPMVSYESLLSNSETREWVEIHSSNPIPTPEILLMVEETSVELEASLHCLSQENQKLVRLYYFEGLSYQEISRIFGVSESAIKSRLHRAREKLKGVLGIESSKE